MRKSRLVIIPSSFPFGEPSAVTATVECPVLSFKSTTSCKVESGRTLESEVTKPALYPLTRATIAA